MFASAQKISLRNDWPAIVTALVFNNWLLAIFFNFRLFASGGDVSSFSANTQPWHSLFHSMDVIAGISLITLVFLMRRELKLVGLKYVGPLLIGLGLGTIADSLNALACTRRIDQNCNIPLKLNLSDLNLPRHAVTSTVLVVFMILPPLIVTYHKSGPTMRPLQRLCIISLGATAIFLLALLMVSAFGGKPLERLEAGAQMIQMSVLGLWVIYLWVLVRATAAKRASPRG